MAIKGKAIITTGTGDVEFTVWPEEGLTKAALFMRTAKVKREPGFHSDIDFDPADADVVMIFPNCEYALETIDGWKTQIERLQQYYDEEKNKEKKDGN